jgi:hypothetical protein
MSSNKKTTTKTNQQTTPKTNNHNAILTRPEPSSTPKTKQKKKSKGKTRVKKNNVRKPIREGSEKARNKLHYRK